MDSILLARGDQADGITKGTVQKAASSSRKWNEFTTQGHLDTFLRDQSESRVTEIFAAFAHRLRHNYAGKKAQDELRGSSIRAELNSVSASFKSLGYQDPIRDHLGKVHRCIRRQLKGYTKKDPPPTQQSPLPISIFTNIKRNYISEVDTACSELIEGALFFATRSCEYTKTAAAEAKKTTLLELRDIAFFDQARKSIPQNSKSLSDKAEFVRITFRLQKNDDNGQEVVLRRSNNLLCGVEAWCNIVTRIRSYSGTTSRTTVNTYKVGNVFGQITSKQVISMLRTSVTTIGPENIGVPVKRVGTHSIRTTFALLMSLNGAQDSLIRKKGRWRSDAYLLYIRGYADAFGDMTSDYISNPEKGNFVSLHDHNHVDELSTR